jgi:flavin reductase (DIM6/NTAB) family NADH-FMN oxidoreductase RutF/DNA-binding IclR family transcriptional regulator
VLGEYPTGVTLITSLDENDEPVAMVVGTFSAVSQDPPMVGFMPNNDSSTFPAIAARGRFVASVLGSAHEDLCRAFARKSPDRFSQASWVTTASGIPRLADAVSWFDGTIIQSHEAGDHTIVVASVDDFGVGDANAGLPLLFLRGGYGSFTVPSLDFGAQGYARQLKSADLVRKPLLALAEDLDVGVTVNGLSSDTVVVLHAMNLKGAVTSDMRPVGASFPFAAPIAPSFAAWGTPETEKLWIEGGRHLSGKVDRPALATLLGETRARGFAISRGQAAIEDFVRLVIDPGTPRAELARLWATIGEDSAKAADAELPSDATGIQFPIFNADGIAELVVGLTDFDHATTRLGIDGLAARVRATSRELTELVGGTYPSS